MKIAIDLSPLQSDHRMRGIGYTLINFINNIPDQERALHSFVLYALRFEEKDSPIDLLRLDGLNYEVRFLRERRRIKKTLPGRLNMLISACNQLFELRDLHLGDSRINNLNNVDVFLQTDQSQCLPKGRKLKKFIILYDIIPLMLSRDYLWSYSDTRKVGFSRKSALRHQFKRFLYAYKLHVNASRATRLLAISEHTKNDFINYFNIKKSKIAVTPLGVNQPGVKTISEPQLYHYISTSWGYHKCQLNLDAKIPFLLFVGGADSRRKLDDLVAAFNSLRAKDIQIKLLLSGDSMQGPQEISTIDTQAALEKSSYYDDIVFMGFVDDITRNWLYQNALAFVFPSKYEGFGLPVLEAMSYGCPVISYKNAATVEVAGNIPYYASNSVEIEDKVLEILNLSADEKAQLASTNISQAKKYSWEETAQNILDIISS